MTRIFILSFFFGALSSLAFSFFFLIPLKLVGYTYYFKNLYISKNLKKILNLSLGFGFGYFLVGLHWIIFPLLYDSLFKYFIPIVIIIFPLFFSLFFLLSSYLFVLVVRKFKIQNLGIFTNSCIIALIFFFSEYLRASVLGGFPWNLHAHIWGFDYRFIQLCKYIGVFGLSFLTIFWIVLASNFFLKKNYRTSFFIFVIFPILLFSFSKINQSANSGEFLKLRIVQPNISQENKWSREYFVRNLNKTINLSFDKNKKQSNSELIVWPEVAIPYVIENNSDFNKILPLNLLNDSILIIGALRKENLKNNFKIFNTLFVLSKNGVEDYYDKRKLVPFGEYFPFRSLFNFKKITQGDIDFSSGNENKNIRINIDNKDISFEPLICYEGIFQTFPKFDRKSNLIVNITNDAWFGTTSGPSQHLTASRFRSIEKGLPLVRVANTGISAVFNEKGKKLISIPLGKEKSETIFLKLAKENTIFSKYGNKCLIILIFLVCLFSNIIDNLLFRKKLRL